MATVLIVEDAKVIARLIRKKLLERGHDVLLATNGAEGVSMARSHRPDLILMDIMMPVMGGYEAVEAIQQIDALVGVPIFMLTARYQKTDHEKSKLLGICEYITKPFSPSRLVDKVEEYLRKGSEA